MISPNVNTVCFNIYLEELGKFLGERKAIIVMDGAGWHKSKALVIPSNITITFLPPYSPELNPVERLWKFIKDNTIKNKIFNNLDDLEQAIANFINTVMPNVVASVCKIDYL